MRYGAGWKSIFIMNKPEAKKRAEKLRQTIRKYRYAYHVLNQSLISDAALDSLKKELFDLENQFPDLITPDSPTQRVGGKPLPNFKKAEHKLPMFSLHDAFSEKDMRDWHDRIKKMLPASARIDFYCEHKFDGLAISLEYQDGILTVGSTRGNGQVGEDITPNLKTIDAIPLRLLEKEEVIENLTKLGLSHIAARLKKKFPDYLEARGEVLLDKREFERINFERKKQNLSLYANPRNVAAGSIRQLDPKITAGRRLDSYSYELVTDLGQETHEQEHLILKAFGFKTHSGNKRVGSLEEVFQIHREIEQKRKSLPYEIDGVVVIVNDNEYFEKLGKTGKAPRGAIAYKFSAPEATTVMEDIVVQVGRTGVLTPVAVLKPVSLSGITVTRATLHNKEEIKRLGLKIGDTVIVNRAGDVIPQVIKNLPDLRNGGEKNFRMPSRCPVCGAAIKEDEGGILVRCPNKSCPARSQESLYHFIGAGAFDIKGIGPKLIDKFLDEGLIQDAADLFGLQTGDIAPLERYGEKSSQNIVAAIQANKTLPLHRFLFALGIPHIGAETAALLAAYLQEKMPQEGLNMKNLIAAGVALQPAELEEISSIGPKVSQAVYEWFQYEPHIRFLKKLAAQGIKLLPVSAPAENGQFHNISFVVTGVLEKMTRAAAQNEIINRGGKVRESVSAQTDYLLAGKNPGSKYAKAQALGIKVIDEKEFLNMLK